MAAKIPSGDKPATSHGDDALGYEQARDELLTAVRKLEEGGLPLEESLALWERGEHLAQICQSWLDGARERLAARRPDDDARTD